MKRHPLCLHRLLSNTFATFDWVGLVMASIQFPEIHVAPTSLSTMQASNRPFLTASYSVRGLEASAFPRKREPPIKHVEYEKDDV